MRKPDITAQIRQLIFDAYGEKQGREMLRDLVDALHKTNPRKTRWSIEEVIEICGSYARGEDN